MSTISTHLRNFKEPTREQLNLLFFSLPIDAETHGGEKATNGELEKMEISAVLTLGVQGVEDAYVSNTAHSSLLEYVCSIEQIGLTQPTM